MAIITLSEALLQRLVAKEGTILRDRILCGFCLKVGKRSNSFMVATSCKGKQVRVTLGRWPLLSVDEARVQAMSVLRKCRAGENPSLSRRRRLPTLRECLADYAKAKRIKPASLKRYESILRTHFPAWLDCSVTLLKNAEFREQCHHFAQTKGAALVEVGRGLIGAIIKYLNAVHELEITNPFAKLANAGLMPDRAKPRERKLQERDLPAWRAAVDKLPSKQRDYLLLIALTGLRRNEGLDIRRLSVDLEKGILLIPETKNGKSHTLPITQAMKEILDRRCTGLSSDEFLFSGVSAEHVAEMASRLGAPKFMLHDLRKLLATIGERLSVGDAVLRRILNHTAKRSDVLHRHYVSLDVSDILKPLEVIQFEVLKTMQAGQVTSPCRKRHVGGPGAI